MKAAQVTTIKGNMMGTTSVTMKAGNMRKAEGFIIYPISADDTAKVLRLQSEHRTAIVDSSTGRGVISAYVANYPTFMHVAPEFQPTPFTIDPLDMDALRMHIFATTDKKAGNNGIIHTDNSGAFRII